jgi:tight adherence protein C
MDSTAFLWLGLACLAAAIAMISLVAVRSSSGPVGVAQSLATIEQMGRNAGVARQELAFQDRVISPAWARFASIGRRLTPGGAAAKLQYRLDLAGNPTGWTPDRIMAAKGVGLISGFAVGALIGSHVGAVGFLIWAGGAALAGLFLPDVLLMNRGQKRQQQLRKSLPDALDMLTVSVEAGLGFDAALAQVARNTDGPIAGEFFRVLQEIQIGKSRTEAFVALSERTTVDELKVFVSALTQADRLGIPIANVLREQSREMRLKRRQRAEETAQKVPIKILFPMVFCIFPALFIVIIGPGVINIVQAFTANHV